MRTGTHASYPQNAATGPLAARHPGDVFFELAGETIRRFDNLPVRERVNSSYQPNMYSHAFGSPVLWQT
jgi:hypothetical protein